MARKRVVPFLSGQTRTWAAAVIYAIGQVNFLFDPKSTPHVPAASISHFFRCSQGNAAQKAKVIRTMFKLRHWDPEFSTQSMRAGDPFQQLLQISQQSFIPASDPLVENYLRYRYRDNEIVAYVCDHMVTRPFLFPAAGALGIPYQGNQIYLDDPLEEKSLAVVAMDNVLVAGQTAIDLYRDQCGRQVDITRELLIARGHPHVSLFEIVDISDAAIFIHDLLDPGEAQPLPLVDIALSQTARVGEIIFTELIPLQSFSINGGLLFHFDPRDRQALLSAFARDTSSFDPGAFFDPDRLRRVVVFLQLNRKVGLPSTEYPLPCR